MLPCDHINAIFSRSTLLLSEAQIELALDVMAQKINADLQESNPIVLCVMVGGVIPAGRLLTRLNFLLQVDYIHATRYANDIVGKELEWLVFPRLSLKDRVVLVVDDILDGGITLTKITEYCYEQGASMVKTSVLVEKEIPRDPLAIQTADYIGAMIEDRFVFGYGMDYKGYLRNAPGIYAVAKEDEK